ncbi:MAG TPA: RNB domain-containing ribonuclease, partial [Myxococcota bacterium]|nr:RNB domain-containing ribonuclease [Myxococcota bacterium]
MKKRTSQPKRQSSLREWPTKRESNHKIIFGVYQKKGGKDVMVAKEIDYPVSDIRQNVTLPLEQGAQVKALLKPDGQKKLSAIILKSFGRKLTLRERIARILKEFDIPIEFDSSSLKEAKLYGEKPSSSDKKNRVDFTRLALCTIDGESAKDFDDAVYAEKKGKNILVVVAIADVSHYVKEATSLDREANDRGTSIYYPGHCIPMLPENLSNGLCSLKPRVERLAITVSFEVGPKGGVIKPAIKEAVIKSAARLTYNQVQDFLDDKLPEKELSAKVKASLRLLQRAAHVLRRSREKRGAIDFDLIESVVALDDQGEPMAIHPQDRLDSHRIIEDLMVATNEVVAEFFEKKHLPCLYRVHEAPDQEKLDNFFRTAHAFGALDRSVKTRASSVTEPKALQEIMTHY